MRTPALRPGDVTVLPVSGGFLVGLILPERGPGPWWSYIGTASTLDEALSLAKYGVEPGIGRGWMQVAADDYREILFEELMVGPAPAGTAQTGS